MFVTGQWNPCLSFFTWRSSCTG